MRHRRPAFSRLAESLEVRQLLTHSAIEVDGIVWLPHNTEPQFDRFDLETETWLSPVRPLGLQVSPSVYHIDSNGIVVASGRSLRRYNLNGIPLGAEFTTQDEIVAVHADGDVLFVNHSAGDFAKLESLSRSSGLQIDSYSALTRGLYGSSISTTANRILGRSRYISPGDIQYVSYDDSGHFQESKDSPYHGNFPDANVTWTTADGLHVVDDAGVVMTTRSLEWTANLGRHIEDLAFEESRLFAVDENSLLSFDQRFEMTGSRTLSRTTKNAVLAVDNDDVFVFFNHWELTGDRSWQKIASSALTLPAPLTPPDPNGLRFYPDAIEVANDGTVLLLSRQYQSLFRWNPATGLFAAPIALNGSGARMTYSGPENAVYVAYDGNVLSYENGLIRRIDLDDASPSPSPFARVAFTPFALLMSGSTVFVYDEYDNWRVQTTYGLNGQKLDSIGSVEFGRHFFWSNVTESAYYLGNNDVFRQPVTVTTPSPSGSFAGELGDPVSSAEFSSVGLAGPLHVTPDGRLVVLGSGRIYDGATMRRTSMTLPNSVASITSLAGRLVTLRLLEGLTQVQMWDAENREMLRSVNVSGTPVRVQALDTDRALVLTLSSSGPLQFHVINSQLERTDTVRSIVVTESYGTTVVSESGGMDEISIRLSTAPDQDIVIRMEPNLPGEATASTSMLRFTPDNWSIPQKIVFSGSNDPDADRDTYRVFSLSVDGDASDISWRTVEDAPVVVRILDDEVFSGVLRNQHRVGNVNYFLHASDPTLERFDVATQSWLAPLRLLGTADHPTAFLVDSDGIYVAYGRQLYRYDSDGSNPKRLLGTDKAIWSILTEGDLLFVIDRDDIFNDSRISSFNKLTNTVVDIEHLTFIDLAGASISPDENRIYGLYPGSSFELSYLTYTDSGAFGYADNFHLSGFASSFRTWVHPTSHSVFTSVGNVVSNDPFAWRGRLAESIRDLAFLPHGRTMALANRRITIYDPQLYPVSAVDLSYFPDTLAVEGDVVTTFVYLSTASHGVLTHSFPVSRLAPLPQAPVVDPDVVTWSPDTVSVNRDGSVLLFNRQYRTIFRWDPQTRSYSGAIRLTGSPVQFAYSPEGNTIYVADSSGLIRQVRLNEANPKEEFFAWLKASPTFLGMAGQIVFAVDSSYYPRHYTFLSTGERAGEVDASEPSSSFVWDNANQLMYDTGRLISLTGINADASRFSDSPLGSFANYGGQMESTRGGQFGAVMRLSPNRDVIAYSSGKFFSTIDGTPFPNALPAGVADLVWFRGQLTTIRQENAATVLERWKSGAPVSRLETDLRLVLTGRPVSMTLVSDEVLLIVTAGSGGSPVYTLLNREFERIPATPAIVRPAESNFRYAIPAISWTQDSAASASDIQILSGDKVLSQQRVPASQNSVSPGNTLANGSYAIRVRSVTGQGQTQPWSVPWNFTVDRLKLLIPRPVWNEPRSVFQWIGHSQSIRYELWINDLDSRTVVARPVASRQVQQTIQSLTLDQSLRAGRYAVWVRSVDNRGLASGWSERLEFDVIAAPVAILSGAGSTNDATPLIRWQPVTEAQQYEIVIQSVTTRLNVFHHTGLSVTSLTVLRDLAPGAYTVWVRAWKNGRAVSAWGSGTRLVVQSPPVATAVPGVINWNAVPEAVAYDILAEDSRQQILLNLRTTSLKVVDARLVPGVYRVRIRSVYADQNLSEFRDTTIEIFHAALQPGNAASATMDQTPVIRWTSVAGVIRYEIQVRRAANDSLLYRGEESSQSSHRVSSRLPNGPVRVFVIAYFADGSRSGAGAGVLMTIGAAPRLQRVNGMLQWNEVPDATTYEVWVNYIAPGRSAPTAFVRSGLIPSTSLSLAELSKGRYIAWVRAIRSEAGERYTGTWSDALTIDV